MTTVFTCQCSKEYETHSSFEDELPDGVRECALCGEFGCADCLRLLPGTPDYVHREHTQEEIHDFEILHEG